MLRSVQLTDANGNEILTFTLRDQHRSTQEIVKNFVIITTQQYQSDFINLEWLVRPMYGYHTI